MRVIEILDSYSDSALDQLSADKLDEVANLRLPRAVLIQEIAAALGSQSYVANALAPCQPPTYSFLSLLFDAPEHKLPVAGLKEAVLFRVEELRYEAADGKRLSTRKNYSLYMRILANAWESEGLIDRSEALLLEALRNELGIWTSEHLLLEHHPDIQPLWRSDTAFEKVRNHLLTTGMVMVYEDQFVIAEEVYTQIRRTWGIELSNEAYGRLLAYLSNNQLKDALEKTDLQLSGSKEERIQRIMAGFVPPSVLLNTLQIDQIKDICRKAGAPLSMAKADLIDALVEQFDTDGDLRKAEEEQKEPPPPPEPEERATSNEAFATVLNRLTVDQLSDILADSQLPRSGSKTTRVQRIVGSTFSEKTLLRHLRGADLRRLCSTLGIPLSGVKDERIDRILSWASRWHAEPMAAQPAPLPVSDVAEGAALPALEVSNSPSQDSAPSSAPPPVQTLASPPAGLKDILVDFPDLEKDEQVIVALIKEGRSLTEVDLERATSRHNLGWFLTKAHMADLLAKLKKTGVTPIRIRSAGGINIYEWTGQSAQHEDQLEREQARDTVDALRQGVVPEGNLDTFAVGQEPARRHLLELLDHVQTGRSQFKFLRGAYGAGKTFVCSWLREQAYAKDFAVATVCIGPDQPLSDLPIFFSGLINGLRTPEKRDASALADILESWLLNIHKKTARIEGLPAFDPGVQEQITPLVQDRIGDELESLSAHSPGFSRALQAFYAARLSGDDERARTALGWLRGSSALSAGALSTIGVRGQLEGDQVFPRMRALLQVIAGGHLRGLLLIVDELELVRRFPHARQREAAYETLRLLIDESGENKLPGCLLVCTGTETFFDDQRYGMGSYEALANRVSLPSSVDGHVSVRQPVIQLEGLDRDWLSKVAQRVRQTHATAYGWNAEDRVPNATLERLVDHWTSFGDDRIDRLPRPILRELVHVLDVCEENPGVQAEDFFRMPASQDLAQSVASLLTD